MSKEKPRGEGSPNATRQMLDELDALMERMLALPVNDLEDAPQAVSPPAAFTPKVTPVDPPAQMPEPPRSKTTQTASPTGKIIVGRLSAPPSYSNDFQEPLGRVADEAPGEHARPPRYKDETPAEPSQRLWSAPMPAPEEILPPLVVTTAALERASFPGRRRSPVRLFLLPLWWFNQAFDGSTLWMGGLGRWLRGTSGRRVFGFLGLTLLALAGLWYLYDWMGWTWIADSLE